MAGLMDVLMPSWFHGVPVLAFRSIGSTRSGEPEGRLAARSLILRQPATGILSLC